MTENPYSSPTDASSATTLATADNANPALLTIARQTFLAWEKLRVVYVTILAVITILLIAPSGFLNRRLLLLTAEGAVVANIAYFAGPTIETYIKWLGCPASVRNLSFCAYAGLSVAGGGFVIAGTRRRHSRIDKYSGNNRLKRSDGG